MRAVITVCLVIQLCSCMSYEFIEVDEVKQDSLFLSNIAASNLLAEYDADLDGLFNDREEMYGTSPSNPDTDGDGICDYDEITKYHMNPLSADSDGDGIPDSNSEERREYSYTFRAICSVDAPFSVAKMTDHFQDVVVLKQYKSKLIYQVTFFPEAYHIMDGIPYEIAIVLGRDFDANIQADPIMNFDEEMALEAKRMFVNGEHSLTDLDVIEAVHHWNEAEVMKPQSGEDYPEPFLELYIDSSDSIKFTPNFTVNPASPLADRNWQLEHVILGKQSFFNRTHGSCGSAANFFSTIFRSVGIPTRIIQAVPLCNRESTTQLLKLRRMNNEEFHQLADRISGGNHFLCEVFVGNKWVRFDNYRIYDRVKITNCGGCIIKVLEFDSWRDVDLQNWFRGESKPYQLFRIEEKEPIYQKGMF